MTTTIKAASLETVIEKVGRSLSERFGIRVVCQGNRCCTDGKTIYLPSLPDELPEEVVGAIRGYVDHEAAHILFRSNFRIAKWFRDKYGDDGFSFLNCLEDLRVEEAMRRRFPGTKRNLKCAYRNSVEKASTSSFNPTMKQLAFGICSRGNGYPDLSFVDATVYETLDMIADAVSRASSRRNTKEVAKLAEEAWPIVQERLFPPQPATPPSQQQEPNPTSATDPSDPGGAARDTGDNEAESSQAPQGCAGQSSGNSNQGARKQKTQPGITASIATPSAQSTGHGNGGIVEDLAANIIQMLGDYSADGRVYRIWDTSHDVAMTIRAPLGQPYHLRMAELLPHVAGVRQRLLQTLLAEPKARWLGDKESGRINPRSLHRLAVNTHLHQSPRVFREKVKTKRLHTACTLLIDQSNSMRGEKIKLASQTALVFCEALSRLQIPSSVIGFSTCSRIPNLQEVMKTSGLSEDELQMFYRVYPLVHTHYKHFHESLRNIATRFDHLTPQAWTPLGESILFAARELAQRHEERRLLFVMTDGRPLVGLGLDYATHEHAKATIKRVERAGIEVALVGINETCVRDLHNRSVVVNSLDELPRTVVRQLQATLTTHTQPR